MVNQPEMKMPPELLTHIQSLSEDPNRPQETERSVFWAGFVGGGLITLAFYAFLIKRKTLKF